jgi:hypothetical protein
LSNPIKNTFLPFPYDGSTHGRFGVEDGCFNFSGREKFAELHAAVNKLDKTCPRLLLYGTSGYGKSHLLAAEAVAQMTPGEKQKRIVYLPDCKQMLTAPATYMKSALRLALHLKPLINTNGEERGALLALEDCNDDVQALKDWKKTHVKNEDFIFFIGQINALDTQGAAADLNADEVKTCRDFLNCMTTAQFRVEESSANNKQAIADSGSQSRPAMVLCNGGLTPSEYEASPAAADLKKLNKDHREKVEDETGLIPLYLHAFTECLKYKFPGFSSKKDDSVTLDEFKEVWKNFIQGGPFEKEKIRFPEVPAISTNLVKFYNNDRPDFKLLLKMVCSFKTETPDVADYDARYFYFDSEAGQCHCICGLARRVGGSIIFTKARERWRNDTKNYTLNSNPIIAGFEAEEATLAMIASDGLTLKSSTFKLSQTEAKTPDVMVYETGRLPRSLPIFFLKAHAVTLVCVS